MKSAVAKAMADFAALKMKENRGDWRRYVRGQVSGVRDQQREEKIDE